MPSPTSFEQAGQTYRNIGSYLTELNATVRVRSRLYGDQTLKVCIEDAGLSPVDLRRLR